MKLTRNEHAMRLRGFITETLRHRSVYLLAVLGLMLCAVGWSQSTAGSIQGIVADQSGAVLPNATVTVTSKSTGDVRTVVTNAAGAYTVPNLPPGNYQAAMTATGFAALKTELAVPINGTIRWDAALKTGNVSESITVTATDAHVDTTSHQLDEIIPAPKLENIPSSARTLFSTLTYSLNVAAYIGNDSNDIDYFHQQSNSLTIGGSVFGTTQYMQDGVINVNMLTRTANYQPPVEAAQEVSVVHNGASARFDSPTAVNVVTKGGENAFHGYLYDFVKNDALNAIGKIKANKLPLRYNQFGGGFGGPIIRDRLFFFFNYAGLRQRSSAVSNAVVPTLKQRDGDFSEMSATIYDPATYNPSTGAISPFPNNQIPASRISDFGRKIMAFYPLPTSSNVTNTNYQRVMLNEVTYDSYLGKLDYNIGKQDRIYGAFMTSDPLTSGDTIFATRAFDPRWISSATNAYIEETHIINPQMVNVLRVGYNRSLVFNSTGGVGTENWPKEFGLTTLSPSQSQWMPPRIGLTTGGYAGWNPSIQGAKQNLFQYSDELTVTHGRHTIFAGIEVARVQFNGNWVMSNNGGFSFNGQYTSNHAVKQSGGNSIADLLLGLPYNASGCIGSTDSAFRQYNVMPYIQDDWRISKRLTLNLGLRYDYFGAPSDRKGRSNVYDVATNTNHPGTWRQTYNDWAPRVGFAYGLRPSTSIRGGYGIYYAGIQYNELQFLMANQPNFYAMNNTYPVTQAVPVTQALAGLANPATSSQAPYTLALNMPTPYAQQRNLSIQQSFGSHIVAEVAYLGSNSFHLMRRVNANQAYLPADPSHPAPIADRRPYPWVGDVLEARNTAHANYNAVEGAVRRTGKNLTLFSNFVFSKSLDNASSEQDVPQNLYDLKSEYGLSSFNRKYVFKAGGQARIPIVGRHDAFIHTNSRLLDKAFGNWMLSGVVQVFSGTPFVVTASDLSNTGGFHPQRANASCNGNDLPSRSKDQWFNAACYSQPQTYQFGSEPRNDLIGPRVTAMDMSMFKTFPFGETRSVIFRVDAFGALNHPTLGAPVAAVSNANLGKIISFGGARSFQASIKIAF